MKNSQTPDKYDLVFVITAMSRGGAERVLSVLANHYASIGKKVALILLWHGHVGYELDKKIHLIDLSNDTVNPYLRIPALVLKLRKTLKMLSPKAVISFIAQNNLLTYIACKGLKTRFIPSERNDPVASHRSVLLRKALSHVYAHSHCTVLQTERALRHFPEKVQKNSVVIHNPVSVISRIVAEKEKLIMSAGRLEKQKNHQMLIHAFADFHTEFPEYRLVIYGDGSLKNMLSEKIRLLGIEDCVTLSGNVPDLSDHMAKAEMFVLPSDYEGMSNALMEAMAFGLPCIATNCAGSDELIRNGENGLLTAVGDQEALKNAMVYFATHTELAEKMGQAARDFSSVYTTENVIAAWNEVIRQ